MFNKHLLEENYNHVDSEVLRAVVMKVVLFKIIISSRDSKVAHILYVTVLKIWETVCSFNCKSGVILLMNARKCEMCAASTFQLLRARME
jgi:hypothetical protein